MGAGVRLGKRVARVEGARRRPGPRPAPPGLDLLGRLNPREQDELDQLLALLAPLPHERGRAPTPAEAARVDALLAKAGAG